MAYLLVGCQVLLLVVFAASALGKVRGRAAWAGFVGSVRDLRLVPAGAVTAAAAGTVAGEAAVVPLLAVPVTVPVGLALAGALLLVFTGSVLVTLRRGVRAVCRCFGRSADLPLGRRHVVRNGVLLAAVVLAGVSWATGPAGPHPGGLAVAAVAGLVAAAVLVYFDEIVELFAGPAVGAGRPERGSA